MMPYTWDTVDIMMKKQIVAVKTFQLIWKDAKSNDARINNDTKTVEQRKQRIHPTHHVMFSMRSVPNTIEIT